MTNHILRAYGARELFCSNMPEKLVQQRQILGSIEEMYERIAEEQ